MRSSKSRSRSKQNRNRSVGNIINRVFDSSGPEGKVRGTPQQIIDKYNQLARDAQLGNDRVAAENFQQHSEHYTRMLGEAMREMEQQRQQNQGNYGGQNGGQNGGNGNGGNGNDQNRDYRGQNDRDDRGSGDQPQQQQNRQRDDRDQREQRDNRQDRESRQDRDNRDSDSEDRGSELPAFLTQPSAARSEQSEAFGVADASEEGDSGLVETPESAPKPRSRGRKPSNRQGNPSEAAE